MSDAAPLLEFQGLLQMRLSSHSDGFRRASVRLHVSRPNRRESYNELLAEYREMLLQGRSIRSIKKARTFDELLKDAAALYAVCYNDARQWQSQGGSGRIGLLSMPWAVAGDLLCALKLQHADREAEAAGVETEWCVKVCKHILKDLVRSACRGRMSRAEQHLETAGDFEAAD